MVARKAASVAGFTHSAATYARQGINLQAAACDMAAAAGVMLLVLDHADRHRGAIAFGAAVTIGTVSGQPYPAGMFYLMTVPVGRDSGMTIGTFAAACGDPGLHLYRSDSGHMTE